MRNGRFVFLCRGGCGIKISRVKTNDPFSFFCEGCERRRYEEAFYKPLLVPANGPARNVIQDILYGGVA